MLNARTILISLSLKYEGDWEQIYDAIKRKDKEGLDEYLKKAEELKCKAITIMDPAYPELLRQIYRPPFVIYYYGNLSLLNSIDHNVAVVGTRNPSDYGENITKKIVEKICKKFVVVSGLAKGIDCISHQACIDSGGSTIAVLGSGIDYCYPSSNKELYEEIKNNHLLISEYPNLVKPNKNNFPMRNRIIAGLSKSLLITEAKEQSGTSITAHYALEFGRLIMAVPTHVGELSACNRLIRSGAILVETGDDVIEEMKGYPYFEKFS